MRAAFRCPELAQLAWEPPTVNPNEFAMFFRIIAQHSYTESQLTLDKESESV